MFIFYDHFKREGVCFRGNEDNSIINFHFAPKMESIAVIIAIFLFCICAIKLFYFLTKRYAFCRHGLLTIEHFFSGRCRRLRQRLRLPNRNLRRIHPMTDFVSKICHCILFKVEVMLGQANSPMLRALKKMLECLNFIDF